jgi:hypothetical protein
MGTSERYDLGIYKMKSDEMRDRIAANIFNKPEQSKMTRTEAHAKLFARSIMNQGEVVAFISALEALGLMKFEEPNSIEEKQKPSPSSVIALVTADDHFPHVKADAIINELLKYKYKIVDTEKCLMVEIGEFTTVRMEDRSYIQGVLEYINQYKTV